jgi:hypothetical protein
MEVSHEHGSEISEAGCLISLDNFRQTSERAVLGASVPTSSRAGRREGENLNASPA